MSEQQTEEQKKERKGGAAPWMQGSAQVGSGSLGGAGASGASGGMLASIKAAVGVKTMVAAIVGVGASVGGLIGLQDFSAPRDPGEAVFMARESSASMQEPIIGEVEDGSYNALELARRANSGAYGEVQGEAGVPAQEGAAGGEAAASAEGVESAEDAADAPGAIPGMDPDALAKMAEGMSGEENSKAKKGLGQKFGKLSSSLGGAGGGPRLAGGAGLSGGIGGNFKQKELSNRQLGQLQGSKGSRQVARTKTAARGQTGNLRKGAFNRLNNMNRAMGNAQTGTAAETAASHTQQWDSSQATGEGITGAGASGIGAGGGSEFSADEGSGGGNPLPGTNTSGGGDSGPAVQDVGGGKNVTPYQNTMDMMVGMIMLANVVILILGILAAANKTPAAIATAGVSAALYGIVVLLMAAVAIGALMIGNKHGQMGQGGLLATAAATTGTVAAIAMASEAMSTGIGWTMIIGSVASIALAMGGLAKGDKVREDEVKQQEALQQQADAPPPTVQDYGGGAQ